VASARALSRQRKRESNPSCSHNAELKRDERAGKGDPHEADGQRGGRAVESVRAKRAQQAWENGPASARAPFVQACRRPQRDFVSVAASLGKRGRRRRFAPRFPAWRPTARLRFWVSAKFSQETRMLAKKSW
jgi:hypothetical protein